MTRRRVLVAAVVVVAVVSAAWYGDLAAAVPARAYGSEPDVPLLQSGDAAVRFVESHLGWGDRLPHDAVLRRLWPYTHQTIFRGGRTSPPIVVAYELEYAPHDAITMRDRIHVQVRAATARRCLDGGVLAPGDTRPTDPPWTCAHYVATFPLRIESLQRSWRPWPVRAAATWWRRRFAPQFAAPATIRATCGDRVDVETARRVLAAVDAPLALKGATPWGRPYDRLHPWESARAAAGDRPAATMTWSPPYPTVPSGQAGAPRVPIREAIVVDGMLQDVPERAVLVLAAQPGEKTAAGALMTTDDDPVCPPLRTPPAARTTAPRPTFDAIVAVAVQLAQDEARRRSPDQVPSPVSKLTGTEWRPGAIAMIDVETRAGAERWTARFTVDEREPALRDAEFTRL